jgi:deoxyadenosine/deoxycytidine kinase
MNISGDKHFIVIAGNIGVGKSTLTRLLADRLNWEPYFEAVDDNPYLADFYADMPAWAFQSQVFFLTRRTRHHRLIMDAGHSVIQDRSIYEDAEIFARNLYNQGNMAERDWLAYRDLYEIVVDLLPPPDAVIYLQASVTTLMERIQLRGRQFEKNIEPGYLARLNALYELWIEGFSLSPVLTVPADELDFVAHTSHLELILDKLTQLINGSTPVGIGAEDIQRANEWAA